MRQPKTEIISFGTDLTGHGISHHNLPAKEYGEELISATKPFNTEKIWTYHKKEQPWTVIDK